MRLPELVISTTNLEQPDKSLNKLQADRKGWGVIKMPKAVIKNRFKFDKKRKESGAALAIALIIVAILSVIALTALAFSSSEARMAGSDLQRMQTFYATASSIEKMTNDFSNLFRYKMRPTANDLNTIANNPPDSLLGEGFTFQQTLQEDTAKLQEMQTMQGLPGNVYPRVNIPEGPFAGLYSTIVPYKLTSTGNYPYNGVQIKLEREFNNYLIPLFQFGLFSNSDIELSPGVSMTFNGRIHSNENLFALQNVKFLNRLTMAGELVTASTVDGVANNLPGKSNVWVEVNSINVKINKGSVGAGSGTIGGPYILGSTAGTRGYYPGRPQGIPNSSWESTSILPAINGTANRFGGQILTGTTGVTPLKMPLQLEGSSVAELIKRSLPTDSEIVKTSRYQAKSQVRILLDDETAGSGNDNAAGIPAGKGVALSTFAPIVLNGGSALRRVDNSGAYIDAATIVQSLPDGSIQNAMTVRSVKSSGENVDGHYIPPGAGIGGRILIEVTRADGTTVDVTREILSMGMTEGEPNGIIYLQRPLWAAYTQGSRDRSGNGFDLVNLTRNTQKAANGEIQDFTSYINSQREFISGPLSTLIDGGGATVRSASPTDVYNQIVPINIYNVREGWFRSQMDEFNIYERGVTSVVEINMRNLARWLDGIYDSNLLSGTNAISANIKGDEGYVIYISDRRGDKVKAEYTSDGTSFLSTNGTVDNEDIYGPNNILDEGEDVLDYGWDATQGAASKKGTLQKDTSELPDTGTVWAPTTPRITRANQIMQWSNPNSYFRRAVRLFDGETLSFTAANGKLSPTKGITIASENMVYVWGSYNTTGITSIPSGGSTLNDGGYLGPQIPASIVCDAVFPLSKTWFDGLSALYPEGSANGRGTAGFAYRLADDNLPNVGQSTSVRAAFIIGTTKGALSASPGRSIDGLRRNGGTNNFPRFLEIWNWNGQTKPWNYTGSINPLYFSSQALSQWENSTSITYMPPQRNWSFDATFLNPNKLPPGTPFFQYVQATGFRQIIHD